MPPRYSMLAIDLDGTLLNSRREVSATNIAALKDAREAGIAITVCTGRGLQECDPILSSIAQVEPVVVAGGSIMACPVRRATLNRFALDPGLVSRATHRLLTHGHPVLVFKDSAEAGFDYLVVTGEDDHPLDPVTKWWFEEHRLTVRYARDIAEDTHPEHTVRFGVCALSSTLEEVAADLTETFGDRATMHHFPAVVAPEHARTLPSGERLHVLEVFDAQANKWSAIRWIADQAGVPAERIAAIGDEINDLSMIKGAGLGIAMGNAVPKVREAASRVTHSCDEDGVSTAVRNILQGHW